MSEMVKSSSLASLRKHLILLGLTRGLILWYAIEKLFETSIGITAEQIVLIGVVAQGSKVVFEFPTSVFADRWNRRNVLILAEVSMIVCCIVLGFAASVLVYVVGTLFWSFSDALSSGVYEAFAYDSIAETGHKSAFQKVYTRMESGTNLSLAVGGVIAGILGAHSGLRISYFLSIVPAAFSILLLAQLKEPAFKRTTDSAVSWVGHINGSLKMIVSSKVRWPAAIYISFFGFLCIWYEYYQLLGVQGRLTPVLFGSLISVLTIGMVVGAEIAHKLSATKFMLLVVWLVLIGTHVVGLQFSSAAGVFASLFVTFIALQLLLVYLEVYLQDNIPSDRRASIMSLLATFGYIWFFILAALFVSLLKHHGARATLMITSLPLLAMGIVDILKGLPWATNKKSPESVPKDAFV